MAWERYRVGRLGEERYGVGASGGLLGAAVRAAASQPCGCELASPFFANPIQNEFCGIGFFTPEPAGTWAPLRPGRWVYEKEGTSSPVGGMPGKSGHLSTAACEGRCWSRFKSRRIRVVPYGLPGYQRSRRAPPQHRRHPAALTRAAGGLGIWEDSFRRKGIPRVRRGVGSVGDWRFARPYNKPPGVPTGWGSLLQR